MSVVQALVVVKKFFKSVQPKATSILFLKQDRVEGKKTIGMDISLYSRIFMGS